MSQASDWSSVELLCLAEAIQKAINSPLPSDVGKLTLDWTLVCDLLRRKCLRADGNFYSIASCSERFAILCQQFGALVSLPPAPWTSQSANNLVAVTANLRAVRKAELKDSLSEYDESIRLCEAELEKQPSSTIGTVSLTELSRVITSTALFPSVVRARSCEAYHHRQAKSAKGAKGAKANQGSKALSVPEEPAVVTASAKTKAKAKLPIKAKEKPDSASNMETKSSPVASLGRPGVPMPTPVALSSPSFASLVSPRPDMKAQQPMTVMNTQWQNKRSTDSNPQVPMGGDLKRQPVTASPRPPLPLPNPLQGTNPAQLTSNTQLNAGLQTQSSSALVRNTSGAATPSAPFYLHTYGSTAGTPVAVLPVPSGAVRAADSQTLVAPKPLPVPTPSGPPMGRIQFAPGTAVPPGLLVQQAVPMQTALQQMQLAPMAQGSPANQAQLQQALQKGFQSQTPHLVSLAPTTIVSSSISKFNTATPTGASGPTVITAAPSQFHTVSTAAIPTVPLSNTSVTLVAPSSSLTPAMPQPQAVATPHSAATTTTISSSSSSSGNLGSSATQDDKTKRRKRKDDGDDGDSRSEAGDDAVVRQTSGSSGSKKDELLAIFASVIARKEASVFSEPVDIEDAPDYYEQIAQPMHLNAIRERIEAGEHSPLNVFALFSLVYCNALAYNSRNSSIAKMARELDAFTIKQFKSAFPDLAEQFRVAQPSKRKDTDDAKLQTPARRGRPAATPKTEPVKRNTKRVAIPADASPEVASGASSPSSVASGGGRRASRLLDDDEEDQAQKKKKAPPAKKTRSTRATKGAEDEEESAPRTRARAK